MQGFHFLRGAPKDVEAIAHAVGITYRYLEQEKEYAHTAGIVALTPNGTVARYLYGVVYKPRDLRLAVAEAKEGQTTSTVDRILLYCFHYDATVGRYAPVAANVMRICGAVTLLALASTLALFWWRYEKKLSRA